MEKLHLPCQQRHASPWQVDAHALCSVASRTKAASGKWAQGDRCTQSSLTCHMAGAPINTHLCVKYIHSMA